MADNAASPALAELVASAAPCTLDDLCLACSVDAAWIVEMVQHGVIDPIGRDRSDWRFTAVAIVVVAKAKRLERDLGLNPPGVALALQLLAEIDDLRAQLRSVHGRATGSAG
jgi:chaperone modulatory protein CbpM